MVSAITNEGVTMYVVSIKFLPVLRPLPQKQIFLQELAANSLSPIHNTELSVSHLNVNNQEFHIQCPLVRRATDMSDASASNKKCTESKDNGKAEARDDEITIKNEFASAGLAIKSEDGSADEHSSDSEESGSSVHSDAKMEAFIMKLDRVEAIMFDCAIELEKEGIDMSFIYEEFKRLKRKVVEICTFVHEYSEQKAPEFAAMETCGRTTRESSKAVPEHQNKGPSPCSICKPAGRAHASKQGGQPVKVTRAQQATSSTGSPSGKPLVDLNLFYRRPE
jgi:predicted GNAT family acetyltransferase